MTDLSMTDLSTNDLSLVDGAAPSASRPMPWIAILYAAALFAGGIGFLTAARGGATDGIEWQLALLLRFMAIVKGSMVLGAVALTHWRLHTPIGGRAAIGYILALAAMALSPGLIWSMAHIISGAACFHAGLLVFLMLAWRDGEVRLPKRLA